MLMFPTRSTQVVLAVGAASCVLSQPVLAKEHTFYAQHNLVSDGTISAEQIDPALTNPWGIAFNPMGVWWVSDNHSGVSTLYDGDGLINSLIVNIPGSDGGLDTGAPTGIVFSG